MNQIFKQCKMRLHGTVVEGDLWKLNYKKEGEKSFATLSAVVTMPVISV